mmetsp:Transcript_30845/g.64469  ORF Transcript_30845/g.64469 Transcript_30845/m.64469 type:complete len:111 (+) Transcript_30845:375-707(+)
MARHLRKVFKCFSKPKPTSGTRTVVEELVGRATSTSCSKDQIKGKASCASSIGRGPLNMMDDKISVRQLVRLMVWLMEEGLVTVNRAVGAIELSRRVITDRWKEEQPNEP